MGTLIKIYMNLFYVNFWHELTINRKIVIGETSFRDKLFYLSLVFLTFDLLTRNKSVCSLLNPSNFQTMFTKEHFIYLKFR